MNVTGPSVSPAVAEPQDERGQVLATSLRDGLPQVNVTGTGVSPAMAEPQDEHGQVLAGSLRDGLLTIMTPVFPDNQTLALLHNQVRPPPWVPDLGEPNRQEQLGPRRCSISALAQLVQSLPSITTAVAPGDAASTPSQSIFMHRSYSLIDTWNFAHCMPWFVHSNC